MQRARGIPLWLAFSLCFGPAVAQSKTTGTRPETKQKSPATAERPERKQGPAVPLAWHSLDDYDERRSRAAFAACDRDGDDRLNVREARACLTGMGDANDPSGFRALDANRNGFLHWIEFDQRFRTTTQRGAKFRFRPARPFTDPSAKRRKGLKVPREHRAAELVVSMANLDDDPDISKSEFRGLLQALGQPASLNFSFGAVDLDNSGGLSKAEFIPILNAVPYLANLVLTQSGKQDPSVLRPDDLERRLARLHPTLQRWSRVVFRGADGDGDGVLGLREQRTKLPPKRSLPKELPKGLPKELPKELPKNLPGRR